MRLLVPAAIAVLLAAITTELYVRLYSGHELALLTSIAVAIFAGALAAPRAIANLRDERRPAPSRATVAADRREAGRVKWFNRSKGFGFIVRDDGGEVFVHHRNIVSTGGAGGAGRQSLRDGQRVSFVVVESKKGLQAEHVTSVDD